MFKKDQIVIRQVKPTELVELQLISQRTFSETFAKDNTPEDMECYLEEKLSIDELSREYADPCSTFYFAVYGDEIIGYLKVNQTLDELEIERIYVLQEFHGLGIGQLILDKAIELAKNANCQSIWLGVWEHNPRAIRFYEKNGFIPYGSHVFKLGNDEQRDVLMRLQL